MEIKDILHKYNTIAVVGLSESPSKASHGVSKYMMGHGYNIIPVNPLREEILGQKVYATLSDIPVPVDVVCLFRPSEDVPPFVDEAIAIGAKVVWMQLGIAHYESAAKAESAGVAVVMNRCIKIEHAHYADTL